MYENMSNVVLRSQPDKADVYINNVYIGKSPISVSLPDQGWIYRLEKKRYLPLSDSVSITNSDTLYYLEMEKDYNYKRFFISGLVGYNTTKSILPAISTGIFGQRGLYVTFSRSFPLKDEEISVEVDNKEDGLIYMGYTTPKGYYLVPHSVFYRDYRFILGLTHQFSEQYFLKTGLGYAQSTILIEFIKTPYRVDVSDTRPVDEIIYGFVDNESFMGIAINLGFIYRIKNRFLVYFEGNAIFSLTEAKVTGVAYKKLDGFIGIGYIF